MGGLSPVHLILLMAVALIVFGPKKLPEIGRGIGQALREFTKAKNDFMNTIQSEMDQVEHSVRDTLPRTVENAYSAPQSQGAPGSLPRTAAYTAPTVVESADALPYGGDFHAAEGESQLAFRTAQPDAAPALAAAQNGSHQGSQLASGGHLMSDAGSDVNAGKA